MIKSRQDLIRYLDEDRKHLFKKSPSLFTRLSNPIYIFEVLLRKCEYYRNTSLLPSVYMNPIYLIYKMLFKHYSYKLGFSIPENCFEEGLSIAHYGTIVVNPNAKIGKNCRIHVGVNIGMSATSDGVPIVGDKVYIGPGAKLFGDIIIGDDTVIGANAVVNKSFPQGKVTLGGVPARIISEKSSKEIMDRNINSDK